MAEQLIQVSDLELTVTALADDFIHLKALADNGDYKITVADFAAAIQNDLALGTLAFQDTVNNNDWVGSDLAVGNGGTGASDPANARFNLEIYSKTETDGRYLLEANNLSDVDSVVTARSNLGLGSISLLNTINGSNWSGTDLAIADGGTGASTALDAFNNIKQQASTTYSGAVQLVNSTASTSLSLAPTANALKAVKDLADTKADKATFIYAGNGLTGGGSLEASRTITLGTPTTLSRNSTNIVTGTSHSHAIDSSVTTIKGGILLFSGTFSGKNPIPTGGSIGDTSWQICDGTNGTPDLRDKFVVGSGSTYSIGQTGGSKDAVVVSHSHSASVNDPKHEHPYDLRSSATGGAGGAIEGASGTYLGKGSALDPVATGISVSVNSAGQSGTDKNLPPYYALAYIMKI